VEEFSDVKKRKIEEKANSADRDQREYELEMYILGFRLPNTRIGANLRWVGISSTE